MTYAQLLSLIQTMTVEEQQSKVMSHNNGDGIWCYPVAILSEVVDNELQVVLDDGMLPEFHGQIVRE